MNSQITKDNLSIGTAVSADKLKQNILDAGKHCLKPIDDIVGLRREGTVALIGGGPSLANFLNQITDYDTVIICGSAHDYVVGNLDLDVQEVYCVICDPDPIMCNYLRNRDKRITYLIASQCDETMFRHLKHMPKKYLWNAMAGKEFNEEAFKVGDKVVTGGCTVGTRGIGIAMVLGFKKMHLFGFDSCLTNTYKHHAYEFDDPDVETLGEIREVRIGHPEKGKLFRVSGYMLAQIFDFQYILRNFANDLDITVYGDGALSYIMKLNKIGADEFIKNYTREKGEIQWPLQLT